MASSHRPPPEYGFANAGGIPTTVSDVEYQFAHPSPPTGPFVSPTWTSPRMPPTTRSYHDQYSSSSTPSNVEALQSYQHEMLLNLQRQMDEIRLLTSQRAQEHSSSTPQTWNHPPIYDVRPIQSPAASGITEVHPLSNDGDGTRDPLPLDIESTPPTVTAPAPPTEDPPLIDLLDELPPPDVPPGMASHFGPTPTVVVPGRSLSKNYLPPSGDPDFARLPPKPPPPAPLPFTKLCSNGSVRVHPSSISLGDSTTLSQATEDSKLRKEDADTINPLPADAEGARSWGAALVWTLRGRYWYGKDSTGSMTHVTSLTATTSENSRLSDDFLSLILMCASKHKTPSMSEAVRGLLMDTIQSDDEGHSYDGMSLVQGGKGIEIFQQRILTGYQRGLGSELSNEMDRYFNARQRDRENLAAFNRRMTELRTQAKASALSTGKDYEEAVHTHLLLHAMKTGAYKRVLEPWARKVQLGHNRLNMRSDHATMLSKAGDVLVCSDYYQDGILQAGQTDGPKARIASNGQSVPKEQDEMRDILSCPNPFYPNKLTDWITGHFSCGYCVTKSNHSIFECNQLKKALAKHGKVISDSSSIPSTSPGPPSTPQGGPKTVAVPTNSTRGGVKGGVTMSHTETASRVTGESMLRQDGNNRAPTDGASTRAPSPSKDTIAKTALSPSSSTDEQRQNL